MGYVRKTRVSQGEHRMLLARNISYQRTYVQIVLRNPSPNKYLQPFGISQIRNRHYNMRKAYENVPTIQARREEKGALLQRMGSSIKEAFDHLEQVGVVDANGKMVGQMTIDEALEYAKAQSTKENRLNLVLVSEKPPICRLQSKKTFLGDNLQKAMMKDGSADDIKEHRISSTTSERDLQMKVRVIRQNLLDLARIKIRITFKNIREKDRSFAELLLQNIKARVSDLIEEKKSTFQEDKKEFYLMLYPNVKAIEKRIAMGIVEPSEGEIQLETKGAAFLAHHQQLLQQEEEKKQKKAEKKAAEEAKKAEALQPVENPNLADFE